MSDQSADPSSRPASPTQAQQQTQTQTTSVSNELHIRIASSSDPGLERFIFADVASAGRQLGRLADVVAVLLDGYERAAGPGLEPRAAAAIQAFREMQSAIAARKSARSVERVFEALETLRNDDPAAFAELAGRLRRYLDDPREPSGGARP